MFPISGGILTTKNTHIEIKISKLIRLEISLGLSPDKVQATPK